MPNLPFIDNSDKLHKLLATINLNRSEVFICNTTKHRKSENHAPLICDPGLSALFEGTTEFIQPKVIITLGRFARSYFSPMNQLVNI